MLRARLLIGACAVALASATPAAAQTADNVLLVINEASHDSIRIAEYYIARRGVRPDHVVRLKAPITDGITRPDYEKAIELPIAKAITSRNLHDRVLYVVLTKGMPLRIVGTGGLGGTVSSVDSELALLYRRLLGITVAPAGRVPNPYYLGNRPVSDARPFSREMADIYLVTRLDGFTASDVIKMIDRGMSPARDGRIVLDQKGVPGDRGGDVWLREAADRLSTMGVGDRVLIESTRARAQTTDPVIGYFSWGSNDASIRDRRAGLTFANGAIAGLYVSVDGRTFREPPASWTPTGPPSAFGDQTLAGDLLREGLSGMVAHVSEPLLDGIVRPQILFPAYVSGLNLAESFYLSMPFLSWQQVVIGDPLVTAFPRKGLAAAEMDPGIDPAIDLPRLFAERRLELLKPAGMKTEALRLTLKADGLRARDAPEAEIDAVLTEATKIEPRLASAQFHLAQEHESRGEHDRAIDRYQAIIAADPNNTAALNNLAFQLAEHRKSPKEALPLAQRAYRVSGHVPAIADTLAWIHHLLGDNQSALPLIERAVVGASANAEIRFHAAVIHDALGNRGKATQELQAALKNDPSLASRQDVQALRTRLGIKSPQG
jgi:uncharacterized protein (TIGR03790 family)